VECGTIPTLQGPWTPEIEGKALLRAASESVFVIQSRRFEMLPMDKKQLVLRNTAIWLISSLMPFFFQVTLGHTRFPWVILIPIFNFGFLLYSNGILSRLSGESPQSERPLK
jgi:hypothetical protein